MLDRLPPAAWAPPAPRRLLRLPANAGLLVCAVLVLGVSGGLLWTLGINYDGLTGSPVQKLHPATYLAAILFGLAMLRAGNPVAHGARELRPPSGERRPVGGEPRLLPQHRPARRAGHGGGPRHVPAARPRDDPDRRCRRGDPAAPRMADPCRHDGQRGAGLVEFATGQRFFPYRLDGAIFETDTRSAALQGHPLGNATLTACYVLALLSGGGRLPDSVRIGFVLLQSAALVTFGGRSGIVITLLLGGGRVGLLLFRALVRNRISLPAAMLAAFALPWCRWPWPGSWRGASSTRWRAGSRPTAAAPTPAWRCSPSSTASPARPDHRAGHGPGGDPPAHERAGMGHREPDHPHAALPGRRRHGVLTVTTALFLREVAHRCRPGIALPMIAFLILINTFESLGARRPCSPSSRSCCWRSTGRSRAGSVAAEARSCIDPVGSISRDWKN